MIENAMTFVEALLIGWLKTKPRGLDGESWTFSRGEIEDIPAGYYAAVRIELHKLGGEPAEYEKCEKCREMHEKGKPCPYVGKEAIS